MKILPKWLCHGLNLHKWHFKSFLINSGKCRYCGMTGTELFKQIRKAR